MSQFDRLVIAFVEIVEGVVVGAGKELVGLRKHVEPLFEECHNKPIIQMIV